MKRIPGAKITFTKADVSHSSEDQPTAADPTKALYVFGHILNKLKLLEAQVFSQWQTATNTSLSAIERQAAVFGVFEFVLLLAGELKEGWEAIQSCYHNTQLSKTLNEQLPENVRHALKRLPQHFTATSVSCMLRNDFSYHHCPDKIFSTARILEHDDPHVAYLFDHDNNYFDYATKLRIAAVAESLQLKDWRTAVEHLVAIVVKEVFGDVSMVLNAILAKLFDGIRHHREAAELANTPSDNELAGHYFFYTDLERVGE